MTQYWKAVRPDGTDFWTVTINYADALGGDPITLPEVANPQCCTSDVLHASDVATETLGGGSWRCRLFLVEGEPVVRQDHNYGFFSLRVVGEVDSRLTLGPNADAVMSLVDKGSQITLTEARKLNATWNATRAAARDAAWEAAREDAREAAWEAAWYIAWEVAQAAVVRDLISDKHYKALAGPWESMMGPIFPSDTGISTSVLTRCSTTLRRIMRRGLHL